MEKTTTIKRSTDVFYDLELGSAKYRTAIDDMNKFVENNQLLDADLWKLFVEQFRSNVDDFDKGWRGEYFGKMMRGGCLTYQYTKNKALYKVLKDAVKDMLTTQDKLGRFSTYSVEAEFDGWDMWSRKYILLGMIYFYDICLEQGLKDKILRSLKKHADYIVKKVGPNKNQLDITKTTTHWGGLNSCSILEPFVKLYNLTSEQKYLDFATYIISTGFNDSENIIDYAINKTKPPYKFKYTKAYEMMSCFHGLLEYYRVTKEEKYLTAVINFADMVIDTDISAIGTSGCTHELFDNSKKRQTEVIQGVQFETCVTATWMNLCYQLLLITGDSKYADLIELSSVNGMFGAVNTEKNKTIAIYNIEEGRVMPTLPKTNIFIPFDSYSPIYKKQRATGTGGYRVMANDTFYGCCACIGSMGTALGALYGVMEYNGGYVFNLYDKGVCKLVSPSGQEYQVKIEGDAFTGNGKIKFIFNIETGEKLKFKFRIPNWSTKTTLMFNGVEYSGVEAGSYFEVEEFIENRDVIEIDLDNRIKTFTQDGKIMLKKGAYVLARDERYREDIDGKVQIKIEPNGTVKGKLVKTGVINAIGEYQIPLKKGGYITMCDYASAGKKWDDKHLNRITVWMD